MTITETNFNELEGNLLYILSFLSKQYPKMCTKQEIAKVTKLHENTVYKKMRDLILLKLANQTKEGRTPYYYIDEKTKDEFDKWSQTDFGK